MPSPSRTNRFQSFTPLRSTTGSLRRLKTAFSPVRSQRSTSPSSSISTSTTSPLTRNSSPHSYRSSAASIRHMLALRRKPSVLEFEMEEEKHLFEQELDVLEPRPSVGLSYGHARGRSVSEVHVVGIFEVLDGTC
ncbi:uncharacterized protein K460DRAFT_359396 [Cucurbitaria berberidis CBS 394.84]|uniref:Uncharacterized protein n=1 Tax=Cucurbitaria berberidis CBS 394.84 TaxID=1168544 RepID=A0A9P4G860_9PLEO|nr:uncharacterized protein K460DRAFT_359396 [Cucurbitaria berberidis CBS 394.84]KAF1840843.1 hypothetical protein K460DRAFT_359396 [Cucurbitaria berberidis CBS 394.84]